MDYCFRCEIDELNDRVSRLEKLVLLLAESASECETRGMLDEIEIEQGRRNHD